MSALLGRIPSAVGYQPTLATDLGALQERITTTRKGSITSVQVRNVQHRPNVCCLARWAQCLARAVMTPFKLRVRLLIPEEKHTPEPLLQLSNVSVHSVGYTPIEQTSTLVSSCWLTVQAIYVPADDLTDPAPATTFAHLDAQTVLSRAITELGIYPAVDPLESTSRMLDARIIGE